MKVKLYNTYMFRDKDPVIDYLRTAKKRAGCSNGQVARDSGVSATTLHNWFDGKTRRPQFATVLAAARGIGPEGVDALAKCIKNGGKK
jgi:DNA-binding phage protein